MKKHDFYCEEVLSGKVNIKKVYESDVILAFHHTKPSYEFHVVIIPKEHIESLLDLGEEKKYLVYEIIDIAKSIASSLDLDGKGARLITNMGKFQDSKHLHFHLVAGKKI